MPGQTVHVVMGAGIVFGVYWRADLAIQHARCLTGTTVAAVDLDAVPGMLRAIIGNEILDALPPEILADIHTEWERDDEVTPEVESLVEVSLDEIEDNKRR